jgi:hypothetical protein
MINGDFQAKEWRASLFEEKNVGRRFMRGT